MTLDEARHVFQQWLHLPDTGSLDVVLATVAANRIEGDPVWLLLVGPPGGGKSEILNAVSHLHDAHPTGTLTEAALLSGTPKKERASESKGGLLRSIGDQGIIVCKDFGSVLSMNRDARAHVLAALREIYDGAWTRHVGTDGGRTLSWKGRVGLVGGVTPTIDRHHAVMGAMGERFTFYRLPKAERAKQARRALSHSGRERSMRTELQETAHAVVDTLIPPRERTQEEEDNLVTLATFVATARSAVERDGYSREIELVPEAESPTRLVNMLARLLDGLDAIGCQREIAFQHVTKVALDSIPALRFALIRALEHDGKQDTNQLGETVRHPASTTRRALEDLTAHELVDCDREHEGKAHLWSLSEQALELLCTFPEMSETVGKPTAHAASGETVTFPEMSETPLQPLAKVPEHSFPEMSPSVVGTTERKDPISIGEREERANDADSAPTNISGKENGTPVAVLLETEPEPASFTDDPELMAAIYDDDIPF